MVPSQLTIGSFQKYPPVARAEAEANLAILQQLPLALAALLMRELIQLDWKFPAERRELEQQFRYLSALPRAELNRETTPFGALQLSSELAQTDWVNDPAMFSERFTAHLWATRQIDAFRSAAVNYVQRASSFDREKPLPAHRLSIMVIGQGVGDNSYPLFRKLRSHGIYYNNIAPEGGLTALLQAVARRAETHPDRYAHWYIDGGQAAIDHLPNVSCLSYQALLPARLVLQAQMRRTYEAGQFDPEAFRSMLARTSPKELGMTDVADPLLNRFSISLLTEGSGTQVFATSFVQWAAREVLRRAQPLTLLARFAPRQTERPMSELLDEAQRGAPTDSAGSLIDADMASYSTWVNQQRLSESESARFLVWFENHGEAIVINQSARKGTTESARISLPKVLEQVS